MIPLMLMKSSGLGIAHHVTDQVSRAIKGRADEINSIHVVVPTTLSVIEPRRTSDRIVADYTPVCAAVPLRRIPRPNPEPVPVPPLLIVIVPILLLEMISPDWKLKFE